MVAPHPIATSLAMHWACRLESAHGYRQRLNQHDIVREQGAHLFRARIRPEFCEPLHEVFHGVYPALSLTSAVGVSQIHPRMTSRPIPAAIVSTVSGTPMRR